jgi:hypothetical protein
MTTEDARIAILRGDYLNAGAVYESALEAYDSAVRRLHRVGQQAHAKAVEPDPATGLSWWLIHYVDPGGYKSRAVFDFEWVEIPEEKINLTWGQDVYDKDLRWRIAAQELQRLHEELLSLGLKPEEFVPMPKAGYAPKVHEAKKK